MAGSSNHPETLPTGIHCLLKPVARSKLLLAIQGMTSKTLLETDVMQPTKAVFEKQLNILIVDDNPVNLKLLETILLTMDQSVTTANNGFEAIECCHHKRFDLILMDVQMPDIDGLETTRRIRKINNIYQRIPIIAVTAHALLEERKQILQSGMDDYTTKPVNTRQLVSTISHWTGNPVQAPDEPTEEQVPGQLKPTPHRSTKRGAYSWLPATSSWPGKCWTCYLPVCPMICRPSKRASKTVSTNRYWSGFTDCTAPAGIVQHPNFWMPA